jgi:RpiR family carbohydrate utilization transcriptional regulator
VNFDNDCLLRIKSIERRTTHAQQKVARYFIENQKKIVPMPLQEIAKEIGVSTTTVLRFVHELGFKSYNQFRISLASDLSIYELNKDLNIIHEDISIKDDPKVVFKKVFQSSIESLSMTLNYTENNLFSKAAKLIYQASKVLVVAVGNSQPIAMDLVHRFLKLGKMAIFFNDPVTAMMCARLLKKNDVIIGISHSGRSVDVINIIKVAKINEVSAIVITSYDQTKLTDIADIKLFSYSKETKFRDEAMASRIVQLGIVDALFVSIAMINPQKIFQEIEKTKNTLLNLSYKKDYS